MNAQAEIQSVYIPPPWHRNGKVLGFLLMSVTFAAYCIVTAVHSAWMKADRGWNESSAAQAAAAIERVLAYLDVRRINATGALSAEDLSTIARQVGAGALGEKPHGALLAVGLRPYPDEWETGGLVKIGEGRVQGELILRFSGFPDVDACRSVARKLPNVKSHPYNNEVIFSDFAAAPLATRRRRTTLK